MRFGKKGIWMSGESEERPVNRALDGTPIEPAQQAEEEPNPDRDLRTLAFERVVRPVGIAVMLTCIAISVSQVAALLAPWWPSRFVSILVFLVCLESIYAQRVLSRLSLYPRGKLRFHFVEWVIILLTVRFGVYTQFGYDQLVEDMSRWSTELGPSLMAPLSSSV